MVVVSRITRWTGALSNLNIVIPFFHKLLLLIRSVSDCHAEVNTMIAGYRREADLSACTLYVTLSPCHDCSKLVAQSGIKNVVFAQYFHNGRAMYETLGRLPDMNIT